MKRFSLKTFLTAILVLSLLIALGTLQYRYQRLEAEVKQLRIEKGHLVPVDRKRVNVIIVPSVDEYTWRWRIYAPPGTLLEYGSKINDIPPDGLPEPFASGGSPFKSVDNGVLITAAVSPDIDGGYFLTLDIGGTHQRISTKLPLDEWLDHSCTTVMAGGGGVEAFDYDEPIILFRRRLNEPRSNVDPKGDARGLIIWLTPRRWP